MLDGTGVWRTEDTLAMVAVLIAVVALVMLWVVAERGDGWKKRCLQAEAECAGLREALCAARYQPVRRITPVSMPEVPERKPVVRPQRQHWTARLGWPGTAHAQLPIVYGSSEPKHLQLDPCLRPPAPTENELTEWLEEYVPVEWPPQRNTTWNIEKLLHGAHLEDTELLEVGL